MVAPGNLFVTGISLHSETQFSDFSLAVDWREPLRRALIASFCSSVYSRFTIYGLCPSRNGYSGQPATVHSFTSLLLRQIYHTVSRPGLNRCRQFLI